MPRSREGRTWKIAPLTFVRPRYSPLNEETGIVAPPPPSLNSDARSRIGSFPARSTAYSPKDVTRVAKRSIQMGLAPCRINSDNRFRSLDRSAFLQSIRSGRTRSVVRWVLERARGTTQGPASGPFPLALRHPKFGQPLFKRSSSAVIHMVASVGTKTEHVKRAGGARKGAASGSWRPKSRKETPKAGHLLHKV
jgi:hypothetical protein